MGFQSEKDTVSVITCDLEGRIETYNEGARALFGYEPSEVVGKERVSLFSDGLVVLGQVPGWLGAAVAQGSFETDTAFRRKDGTAFAAHIRITPTKKDGRHVGFCGVTRALEGVDAAAVAKPPSLGTRLMRWLVVTRAPFLTAIVAPVLLGAAIAWRDTGVFGGALFAVTLAGAVLLHLGANMANDYFDWKSGTDAANLDYVVPFSGGSRAIQLGLVTPRALLALSLGAFALAALCGAWLFAVRGPMLLALGAAGALLGWFYTAPPLRLCARKGLGELAVAVAFGPLPVLGAYFVATGRFSTVAAVASVPMGLLVAAILYINEFPDHDGDKATGKNHLVVVLGKRAAAKLYVAILATAYAAVAVGAATGVLPRTAAIALAGGLFAWQAGSVALRHYADRALLPAHSKTIAAHFVTGLLLAAGFLADRFMA